MKKPIYCEAPVKNSLGGYLCQFQAKHEYEGKHYCGTHYPPNREKISFERKNNPLYLKRKIREVKQGIKIKKKLLRDLEERYLKARS